MSGPWDQPAEYRSMVALTESKLTIWTTPVVGTQAGEPLTMADALSSARAVIERERWAVEREGEREAIIWPVRRAVAMRDDFTCQKCHRSDGMRAELDHIKPWSAGGSDDSTNLRYLCYECNQNRSNRFDGTEHRAMRPVTWWCIDCWTPDTFMPRAPIAYDGYANDWLNLGRWVEHAHVIAYCAKCRHLSRTDMTL